jgi:4-aminobutyrate aminotransferase-like enzyme
MPPLTIEAEEVDEVLERLDAAVAALTPEASE